MPVNKSITPRELAALDPAQRPTLIDVREPWEFQLAHLEGAELKPLGQIGQWGPTLAKDAQYVIMCHHGSRSAMACQMLQRFGVDNVLNLEGGIDAWTITVDPSVRRY